MTIPKVATPSGKVWLIRIGLLSMLLLALTVASSAIAGYGLNLRAFGRSIISTIQAIGNHSAITQNAGDFRDIVFLHHSVGTNLIDEGGVRELFNQAGYKFWDHGYNWQGLRDPSGKNTGYSYNVPNDNTDPDGLVAIFAQPAYGLPLNTFSGLLEHQVIAFKSCFPASDIQSDEQLAQRKQWYLGIRDVMDKHPDKLFIVVTQPPLVPAETKREYASRAHAFADWLNSDEFLKGHPNVVTFDLFSQYAENDPGSPDYNMLRTDYRNGVDSHPNKAANQTVAPVFVDAVIKAIEQFRKTHST
jgi:hypothetical protein